MSKLTSRQSKFLDELKLELDEGEYLLNKTFEFLPHEWQICKQLQDKGYLKYVSFEKPLSSFEAKVIKV